MPAWQCFAQSTENSNPAASAPSAGVLLVGGFVGRGVEMRALQQAAQQLRLAVGVCEAIA